MNLCSDGHEEICFDNKTCPLCAKIEEHKEEIETKDKEIDELQEQVGTLQSLIDTEADIVLKKDW